MNSSVRPRPSGSSSRAYESRVYEYRGTPKPDPAAARAEQIRVLLAEQRRTISIKSSRVRALSSELIDRVAQAICDGVKVAAVAGAAQLPVATVRSRGLSGEELYPTGQSPAQHLRSLAALAEELAVVETARSAIEHHRIQVLATARKLRLMDDYQLASASGLKHEEIRKMTRGVEPGLLAG